MLHLKIRINIRMLTVLLVVIELVNGTSAPVITTCTALETILIEVHRSPHVHVLAKQCTCRCQGGWMEGFSISECVAKSCPTSLQFQFSWRAFVTMCTYVTSRTECNSNGRMQEDFNASNFPTTGSLWIIIMWKCQWTTAIMMVQSESPCALPK